MALRNKIGLSIFIWIIQEGFEGLLTQDIAVKKYWNQSRRPRDEFKLYHWQVVNNQSKQPEFSGLHGLHIRKRERERGKKREIVW